MVKRRRSQRITRTPQRRVGTSPEHVSPQAVMIRDVLHGSCSFETLRNCSTHHLEQLLFKVLDLTASECADTRSTPARRQPVWWPDNVLPFADVRALRDQVKNVIVSWHTALAHILESCVRFYGETRRPIVVLQQHRTPLVDVERRRRTMKALTPVVLLKDVLKCKYPVLDKEDYMRFLKLRPTSEVRTLISETASTPSLRYSERIEFSSQAGRKLLASERYAPNEQLLQRKRDWTEMYLGEKVDGADGDVTYSVRSSRRHHQRKAHVERVYKFPERQRGQFQRAITRFGDTFCRPAYVAVERLNIQPYLLKKTACRRLSVYVDNRETDRIYEQCMDANSVYASSY